jgi:hypothetical protein
LVKIGQRRRRAETKFCRIARKMDWGEDNKQKIARRVPVYLGEERKISGRMDR